jgi:hypothetical protein
VFILLDNMNLKFFNIYIFAIFLILYAFFVILKLLEAKVLKFFFSVKRLRYIKI